MAIIFCNCYYFIYPYSQSIGIGERIFYNVSFLSNFVKCFYVGVMMPEVITWSVSVEEQFYLFWPLLFTFLPTRYWVHLIILTILGSVAFRICYYNDNVFLYFHSLSVLLDLGIGGLFAYLIKTQNKF